MHALSALGVGIQVVEITGQALPEGGGTVSARTSGQSKGVVAAESEARGLESASLDRAVELKPLSGKYVYVKDASMLNLLVIGSDISCATSLVLQDTILQSQGESAGELALLKATLGRAAGLVDRLDLESS